METLDLETYVLDRSKGKPVPITIDTLRVGHWNNVNWTFEHTTALHFLCRLLKVRHLSFIEKDHMSRGTLEGYLNLLGSYAEEGNHPYPNLREISLAFVGEGITIAPFMNLLVYSRVNRLTWDMGDAPFWRGDNDDREEHDTEVALIESSRIINNFWGTGIIMCCPHLREIAFCLPWLEQPVSYERDGIFVINDHGEKLIKVLENNRLRLKKAQHSVIALLALRKRREYMQYRDVLRMIALKIWESSFPSELESTEKSRSQ